MGGFDMIIGLAGKKSSGKTTAANILKEKRKYTVLNYADALKGLCSDMFEIPMDYFTSEYRKEHETINIKLSRATIKEILKRSRVAVYSDKVFGLSDTIAVTPRQLLQLVGTDIFRKHVDTEYWVKLLEYKLDDFSSDNIIVADVRFNNEAAMVQRNKGSVILIERPMNAISLDSHASEQINIEYNYKIVNYNLADFKEDLLLIESMIKRGFSG
jgi:hypothetical protein